MHERDRRATPGYVRSQAEELLPLRGGACHGHDDLGGYRMRTANFHLNDTL